MAVIEGIYIITDRFVNPRLSHVEIAELALKGGANVIQMRDKQATTRQLLQWANSIKKLTLSYNALFIVNDRVDIAFTCDADGVHVGDDDLPISTARCLLGKWKIIGRSISNEQEALQAVAEGADYVSIGPVFATVTKSDAGEPVGLEMVKRIRKVLPENYPLVAIGGINLKNAKPVFEMGANAIAVISSIVLADDPTNVVAQFVRIWKEMKR